MIIFVIIILGFMGICLYGLFMPKYMVKQGRIVDARVISCETKMVQLGDETGSYYEVTVDFYGIHGETIQKKFQSEEYYEVGAVLRSRYIDKTGRFMPDADKDAKNNGGLWFAIGFLVLILVILIGSVYLQDENGELPGYVVAGFGYFVSVVFMIIGIAGLIKQIRLKKNAHKMQVIPGYLVDYTVNYGGADEADTYRPVYEYELMGISYRYQSKVSGSSKKYRTIGRKVHMLRDCETGDIYCKEDEKTSGRLYLIFGIVGLAVFLLLLAGSVGLIQNVVTSPTTDKSITENAGSTGRDESSMDQEQNESKLMVYVMYPEGEEKFSYSIEITESGKGSMILFPTVSVSGKGIDQYIDFKLTISDIVKIGSWVEGADVKNLELEKVDDETLTITVYVSEGEEKYDGRGSLDMPPYGELYELLSDIVPDYVWEEMQEREAEYYK